MRIEQTRGEVASKNENELKVKKRKLEKKKKGLQNELESFEEGKKRKKEIQDQKKVEIIRSD